MAIRAAFRPNVRFEAIILPGAGAEEFIVKASKPILIDPDEEISTKEAARITALSVRRIQAQCAAGFYRRGIDFRQATSPHGRIFLKRASVMAKSGKGNLACLHHVPLTSPDFCRR
ncbi:MAG TPA: hypothetical protein VGF13_18900 [Verrucomicrobiae bacterium]